MCMRMLFCRMEEQGNPVMYANWIDETLNMVLRGIAKHSHATTFHYRVLQSFAVIAALGLVKYLHTSLEEDDE